MRAPVVGGHGQGSGSDAKRSGQGGQGGEGGDEFVAPGPVVREAQAQARAPLAAGDAGCDVE